MNKRHSISVLIPAFNEADSIIDLFERLESVANEYDYDMQVIFVDDGSTDNTYSVIQSITLKKITELTYIPLRRNMGKSEALMEGSKEARYDLLITMDADLQDLPEEFPNLISKLNEGYDLVSGWKKKRNDPLIGKRIPSFFFNKLVRYLLKVNLHDINCGLKIYKTQIWSDINVYGDFHRFIPALAAAKGYRIGEIEVEHHERKKGISKYGGSRFLRGLFDLLTVFFLTTFAKRPLHFFGKMGASFFIVGFSIASYLSIIWFMGAEIGSRPLLLLSTLLIGIGIQIMLFGLIGQLLIDSIKESSNLKESSIDNRKRFLLNND